MTTSTVRIPETRGMGGDSGEVSLRFIRVLPREMTLENLIEKSLISIEAVAESGGVGTLLMDGIINNLTRFTDKLGTAEHLKEIVKCFSSFEGKYDLGLLALKMQVSYIGTKNNRLLRDDIRSEDDFKLRESNGFWDMSHDEDLDDMPMREGIRSINTQTVIDNIIKNGISEKKQEFIKKEFNSTSFIYKVASIDSIGYYGQRCGLYIPLLHLLGTGLSNPMTFNISRLRLIESKLDLFKTKECKEYVESEVEKAIPQPNSEIKQKDARESIMDAYKKLIETEGGLAKTLSLFDEAIEEGYKATAEKAKYTRKTGISNPSQAYTSQDLSKVLGEFQDKIETALDSVTDTDISYRSKLDILTALVIVLSNYFVSMDGLENLKSLVLLKD